MKRLGSRKKFFRLDAACGKPEKKFPGRRSLREAGKKFSWSPQPAGGWKKFFWVAATCGRLKKIFPTCL